MYFCNCTYQLRTKETLFLLSLTSHFEKKKKKMGLKETRKVQVISGKLIFFPFLTGHGVPCAVGETSRRSLKIQQQQKYMYCTVYTVHCTLYCTLYTVQYM